MLNSVNRLFSKKMLLSLTWLTLLLFLQACQILADKHVCGRDCWHPETSADGSSGSKDRDTDEPSYRGNHQQGAEAVAYFCKDPQNFSGKVVGDGHCVSLIRACSQASFTKDWRPGPYVMRSNPKPGSIIATFRNGQYPSRTGYHAAIYISHSQEGIWVWDQWKGTPVHKRLIRFRTEAALPSNTAQAYRLVLPASNQ